MVALLVLVGGQMFTAEQLVLALRSEARQTPGTPIALPQLPTGATAIQSRQPA